MAINGANNVSITLQFNLTSGATTIILPTGKGGLFTGATTPLRGVIEEFDDSKNVVKREIVSITGISGDQLTIARAVEPCPIGDSSSAQQQVSQVFNTPAKTKVSVVMTKGMVDDINSSVSALTTNKLNANGGYRTGLGAKKILVTDASGNETEVPGTTGQVLGFGAGNVPQAMSPSVDIHGQTQKIAPKSSDEFLIADSENGFVMKRILLSSWLSPFGNGSDGNVTISTNTTLVRDMYYQDLTINSTIVLNTNGYRVYVAGTLTNNGIIRRNGNAGGVGTYAGFPTGGVAGAILNQGSLNAEVAGGDGGSFGSKPGVAGGSANPSYTNINGANGGNGAGGGGGSQVGGSGGTSTRGNLYNVVYNVWTLLSQLANPASFLATTTQYKGPSGSGGGGCDWTPNTGCSGGGAGSNGGFIWIAANILNNTSGVIESKGGSGGAGVAANPYFSGGGGGGQGGVIMLIYQTLTSLGTTTVTGGTGGASGGGGATAGGNGNAGVVIQVPITL